MLFFTLLFHLPLIFLFFFFFNDTATTEIYTLSLHDALPILRWVRSGSTTRAIGLSGKAGSAKRWSTPAPRSEEHTSELQSQFHLVCRLLLEKKKKKIKINQAFMIKYICMCKRASTTHIHVNL